MARSRVRRSRARVLSTRVVDLAGYRCVLVRKTTRNIYLRIKTADSLVPQIHPEISAPRAAGLDQLEAFVASHRGWIEQTRAKIEIAEQTGGSVENKWTDRHRREAADKIRTRLDVLLPRWTAVVGRKPTAVSLRVMKTRWGSCTPATGRIRLNLELADLPDRFLDYVLVHELTHLRAPGHGALFQHYMDQYLPDWRQLRRELNTHLIV